MRLYSKQYQFLGIDLPARTMYVCVDQSDEIGVETNLPASRHRSLNKCLVQSNFVLYQDAKTKSERRYKNDSAYNRVRGKDNCAS